MTSQPFLHDLIPTVMAPTQVWSGADGQVHESGAQGVFHGDLRALSQIIVTVDGSEPEPLAATPLGPGLVEAVGAVRGIDGPGADPTTWIRRTTTVRPGAIAIELSLECATADAVAGRLEVGLATDLGSLEAVKQGHRGGAVAAAVDGDAVRFDRAGAEVRVTGVGGVARVSNAGATIAWDARATPGRPFTAICEISVVDEASVMTAPVTSDPEWARPVVTADDPRLAKLLTRSLDDLETLRMSWRRAPEDVFLAAGAPWFFTLFGRDSIWAARLMLPLGTDLARGTLRTLAAGQGTSGVPSARAEQPGKILHEVRAEALALADGTVLPPLYYGTVDATALWVCLLHDAWEWGMSDADVHALLPALRDALTWIVDHGDSDGDGFIDYVDETGSGLANQGWKDSGDSVQWRSGRLAEGPIALCEVQAYAYEAAMSGARLLAHFGEDGSAYTRWADAMATRFRASFWTSDADGPYIGIALDRHGELVDGVASNMGHVLGTGILSGAEEALVAARLTSDELSSGFGLRTLSDRMGGYWPLRYHGGAVWTHDTAIAVRGLLAGGFDAEASVLVRGLLAAAEHTGFQLPELFGGTTPEQVPTVVPYPASCHPQAWSAASAVTILQAALGLRAGATRDAPPRVRETGTDLVGAVQVAGLPGAQGLWSVRAAPGAPTVVTPRADDPDPRGARA